MCRGVAAEDVAIAVATEPGEVAHVDFGYAGRSFDTGTDGARKAWVFKTTLDFSRHSLAKAQHRDEPTHRRGRPPRAEAPQHKGV